MMSSTCLIPKLTRGNNLKDNDMGIYSRNPEDMRDEKDSALVDDGAGQ
jgi:hypothetical protein